MTANIKTRRGAGAENPGARVSTSFQIEGPARARLETAQAARGSATLGRCARDLAIEYLDVMETLPTLQTLTAQIAALTEKVEALSCK